MKILNAIRNGPIASSMWSSLESRYWYLPRNELIVYYKSVADTISLSVSDYGLVGPILQPILFTDADTPIVFDTYAAFYAALSVLPSWNTENGMGTEDRGTAIYIYGTERFILNRALVWFGLPTQ